MSCYVTFGGYRNRKRITRNAIEWFLQHRKLNRFNTFVHIVDKRLWPEDDGACIAIDRQSNPRFFEIEMENRLDNKEQYLTTLFHELIHMQQRLRKTHQMQYCTRTCRTVNKWHGDVIPSKTKYMDEPWEIEAYEREKLLYRAYREHQREGSLNN